MNGQDAQRPHGHVIVDCFCWMLENATCTLTRLNGSDYSLATRPN